MGSTQRSSRGLRDDGGVLELVETCVAVVGLDAGRWSPHGLQGFQSR
jgi:hypothetical protein